MTALIDLSASDAAPIAAPLCYAPDARNSAREKNLKGRRNPLKRLDSDKESKRIQGNSFDWLCSFLSPLGWILLNLVQPQ
jgi:hypothetical protein